MKRAFKRLLKRLFKVETREVFDIAINQYQTANDIYFLNFYIKTVYE